MTEERKLHAKLAEIMEAAERIPKNGKAPAAMGGFPFVQVGDAADFIRKELGKRKVSMLPTAIDIVGESEHETKSGGTMTTLGVRTTWTLTDGETGESAVIQSYGAGADTGDKFSGKAQTNAMKYALLMGFQLSTGDDPELSDSQDRGQPQSRRDASGNGVNQFDASGEALRPLGVITRTGVVAKGSGRNSGLEARQTPEGHHVGFRLEKVDGDAEKNIPQVVAEGAVGTALVGIVGDLDAWKGADVKVTGELFEVRFPGRRPTFRLIVTAIETDEWRIPAVQAPQAEPAPSGLSAEDEAELDKAADAAFGEAESAPLGLVS